MSTETEREAALNDAISDVLAIPRPQLRERILKGAIENIMHRMGWQQVTLPQEDNTNG